MAMVPHFFGAFDDASEPVSESRSKEVVVALRRQGPPLADRPVTFGTMGRYRGAAK